jgi:hypothetical protein
VDRAARNSDNPRNPGIPIQVPIADEGGAGQCCPPDFIYAQENPTHPPSAWIAVWKSSGLTVAADIGGKSHEYKTYEFAAEHLP